MKCLVTGVAGFIGSHLGERLLADGLAAEIAWVAEVEGRGGFPDA